MIIDFAPVYMKLTRGEVRIIEISIVICDRDVVMTYWSRSRFERYPGLIHSIHKRVSQVALPKNFRIPRVHLSNTVNRPWTG